MEKVLSEVFFDQGNYVTKHLSHSNHVGLRRFVAHFGVSPSICAKTWLLLKDDLPQDYQEIHLLWALLFLKCYNTEHVNHSIVGCDEKTFRKRVWFMVKKLAFIKVVRDIILSLSYKKISFVLNVKCRSYGKIENWKPLMDKRPILHWTAQIAK